MENNQTLFHFKQANYLGSPKNRVKGALFLKEEDFKVLEISKKGIVCSITAQGHYTELNSGAPFVELTLVKKGISTFEAVKQLSEKARIPKSVIKYSGLKDTLGVTAQSITIPKKEFLEKQSQILGKKKFSRQFKLINPKEVWSEREIGDIAGNRFEIIVRNFKGSQHNVESALRRFVKYLSQNRIPNYYGHQRFGFNQNNHQIGKHILRGNFESALKLRLTGSLNESAECKRIRKKIEKNWGDWSGCIKALSRMKSYFNEDLVILEHLQKTGNDFLGALKLTGLLYFFIDSYHSYLFNNVLLKLNEEGINKPELPMIGPQTEFNDLHIKALFGRLLESDGLSFKIYASHILAANIRGRARKTSYQVRQFDYNLKKDCLILSFDLPMGVYANLLLDRIISNTGVNKVN